MESKLLDSRDVDKHARMRPLRARASGGRRPSARDRLLRAAAEVFAAHGFSGARVRDIVKAAHANVAAVNYHFGDKKRLYAATVAHLLEEAQRDAAPPANDPREELHHFVLATLEQMCAGGAGNLLARIFLHETMGASGASGAVGQLIGRAALPRLDRLRDIVARIGRGQLPQSEVALSAVSVFAQCCCCVSGPASVAQALGLTQADDFLQALARHIAGFSARAIESATEAATARAHS
jgi:AcrR family transcriptional regulator